MENLKKKLEIINCGDLLEETEGTDFQKIMDSILIKKDELKETPEEEKEIEGEKKFKDTLIYKSLIFYRNIDLENKQVFKQIDVQSICEFFSLNPKYDKFIEKYINNLGNDPLIYGKNKIEIFYILLIALNYLENNNKKTLIIENQIKKYKLTLYFIKHLKSIERNYYFNIFNLVSNNKYLLYLQPVYNTEMETLFLNYFYINKIGIKYEFLERLILIIKNDSNLTFKNNQLGNNFINHRLSLNDSYNKIKSKFFNLIPEKKAVLILRIIFFLGTPLFNSLDDKNMIKTLINLLNTFHRNDKEIIKQIIKLLMEFYKKTNDKYILKLVLKSEIYNKFSKEDKSIINLIMCENLINFKEVLNENLNSLEFLKIYLKEIEIFIKKIIFNNKYELEDLLSFYEHIVFIINISNSYSFQIRKQIFNLLSMTTKYFLDNNKPFKELEDKQLENSLLVYERYKIYSTNITSYLKKIEKCISVIMNEDNHRKLLIDKTIPKFLINMRELEDYLNTFIFLKGINEDFRINKRGFILEK